MPFVKLLTANELAEILRVSRSTLYAMIHRGELPRPLRVGHGARWRLSDVEALLEGNGKRPPLRTPNHRPGEE